MPRRTRTQLISQKKVRGTEPKPHGDMRFPETQSAQRTVRSAA